VEEDEIVGEEQWRREGEGGTGDVRQVPIARAGWASIGGGGGSGASRSRPGDGQQGQVAAGTGNWLPYCPSGS